jgi:hypothetical protein
VFASKDEASDAVRVGQAVIAAAASQGVPESTNNEFYSNKPKRNYK